MENDILSAIDEANMETPPPPHTKKRPGRPPKSRPALATSEVVGIAPTPINSDDLMEMAYCSPMLFKKLLTLFKGYEVSEVDMCFDMSTVQVKARDHLGKSTIYTTIDCSLINYYYCKAPIRICVKREYLDKILGNLDKNQYKVSFLLRENYRSTLYIIVKDCQYDKDKSYEVEVIYRVSDTDPTVDDDINYPIKFCFDSKHFKSEINQVRKMSPLLTIQKVGLEPLHFTFDEAKKLNYNGRYNNPEKIKLQSTIAADDIFNVSIVIDYIKPFSNSCIGDDVFIAADKTEKMSFTTLLDKKSDGRYVASIKIFTEIKDYHRGFTI